MRMMEFQMKKIQKLDEEEVNLELIRILLGKEEENIYPSTRFTKNEAERRRRRKKTGNLNLFLAVHTLKKIQMISLFQQMVFSKGKQSIFFNKI